MKTKIRLIATAITLFCSHPFSVFGQVATTYGFTQTIGTYNPIGGTVVAAVTGFNWCSIIG